MNSWTKVPAKWFSINERATAVGLVTLANLVGTALSMLLTPILTEQMPIPTVQLIFGGLPPLPRCYSSSSRVSIHSHHPAHPGWKSDP